MTASYVLGLTLPERTLVSHLCLFLGFLAKTSADAAKAATDGLTTMVYVAIAASVVDALAAIFAVMQISKKIA